jgi:hypothetical protein
LVTWLLPADWLITGSEVHQKPPAEILSNFKRCKIKTMLLLRLIFQNKEVEKIHHP